MCNAAPAPELRQNPFNYRGLWYWFDETEQWSKPYTSQRAAIRDLADYLDYLDGQWTWRHSLARTIWRFLTA